MTYLEAHRRAAGVLAQAGIEGAAQDASLLLLHVCGFSRTDYLMKLAEQMPEAAAEQYTEAVKRRAQHVPLQHITGEAPFMGYMFRVNENVLVPRPDTETLVERAAQEITLRGGQARVLDLCTGSGCIAVSLAKMFPRARVTGSDISGEALKVARENAGRLGCDVAWIRSDLFTDLSGQFDLIVSNPPYIPSAEIDALDEEVRLHDPRGALDGGADGLAFYRRIISQAPSYLTQDGALCLEIGYTQADDVMRLMREAQLCAAAKYKDLGGRDRVVTGRRRKTEDV